MILIFFFFFYWKCQWRWVVPESLCHPNLAYKPTHPARGNRECVCSAPPLPSWGSLHRSRARSSPGSCISARAKTLFPPFLKELCQDCGNHKAGLKPLHGESEQTFTTNRITPSLRFLSHIWSPECNMGTIRVFPERNWKIEINPREGSQDILHPPRWSSWAITIPSIRADRVNERSSPISVHPQ